MVVLEVVVVVLVVEFRSVWSWNVCLLVESVVVSGDGLEKVGNGLEMVEFLLQLDAEDLGLVDCLLCAGGVW